MNWIDSQSRLDECVSVGSYRMNALLFAVNLLLLASPARALQYTFDRFSVSCDRVGIKIIIAETEVLCSSRNPGQGMQKTVIYCRRSRRSSTSW